MSAPKRATPAPVPVTPAFSVFTERSPANEEFAHQLLWVRCRVVAPVAEPPAFRVRVTSTRLRR